MICIILRKISELFQNVSSLVSAFLEMKLYGHFTFSFLTLLQESSLLKLTSEKQCLSYKIRTLYNKDGNSNEKVKKQRVKTGKKKLCT